MAFQLGSSLNGSSSSDVAISFASGALDAAGLYGHPLDNAVDYQILGAPWFDESPSPETNLNRVTGVDDDHIWIQAADGGAESAGLGIKFAYVLL